MFVHTSLGQPEVDICLLHRGTAIADTQKAELPDIKPPGGLSTECMQYVYKEICPHVYPECLDDLCLCPSADARDDLPAAEDD